MILYPLSVNPKPATNFRKSKRKFSTHYNKTNISQLKFKKTPKNAENVSSNK